MDWNFLSTEVSNEPGQISLQPWTNTVELLDIDSPSRTGKGRGRERVGGGEGEGIMPTVIVHASKSTVCCNALDVFFYAHAEPVLRVVVCEGLSITRSIIHTCQLI